MGLSTHVYELVAALLQKLQLPQCIALAECVLSPMFVLSGLKCQNQNVNSTRLMLLLISHMFQTWTPPSWGWGTGHASSGGSASSGRGSRTGSVVDRWPGSSGLPNAPAVRAERAAADMRRTLTLLISVYASVPVFLYLFPWLLSHAVFAHLCKSLLLLCGSLLSEGNRRRRI